MSFEMTFEGANRWWLPDTEWDGIPNCWSCKTEGFTTNMAVVVKGTCSRLCEEEWRSLVLKECWDWWGMRDMICVKWLPCMLLNFFIPWLLYHPSFFARSAILNCVIVDCCKLRSLIVGCLIIQFLNCFTNSYFRKWCHAVFIVLLANWVVFKR